jgi:hypothetical protein
MLLQRKLNRSTRKKVMCDLDGAKTVGILFTADNAVSYDRVILFVNELTEKRNIKVLSIGYVENKKDIDQFPEQTGFRFFSAKQCNWYGRPKDHSVDYFIEKDFDILLDLNLNDTIAIDFVVGMSKAKYKVGRLKPSTRMYDMMIDVNKNNTLDNLISQIELYLSMFKVEQKTEA